MEDVKGNNLAFIYYLFIMYVYMGGMTCNEVFSKLK